MKVLAPGKLFLFGEHAVIYDQLAIVTALNQRLSVTIEVTKKTEIITEGQDTRFIEAAIKQFAESKNLRITTHSDFSARVGFGSSAAVTIATLVALNEFFNKGISQEELLTVSMQVVQEVQGNGSGADLAASLYGGTIFYQKNPLIVEPLDIGWDEVTLVVGYSGVKAKTGELIEQVAQKQKLYPEKFTRIMVAIGDIVREAKNALVEKDWENVGKLMNFNQEYLRDLGVSTEKLETLISAAKQSGALGAKLSGAGGGDCMIALTNHEKAQVVKNAITQAGGEVIDVEINGEGVRIEKENV